MRGDPESGAAALCAFLGHDDPSDAQTHGALLVASCVRDIHILRRMLQGKANIPGDYDP